MEPLVSVFCTAYNHEKYIRDALEGFVKQKTDFPFEVIVHDDASTDNTAKIIREYEKKYPNIIKPIYQSTNQYSQNIGIIRNILMPNSKGKYIAICEGDDYWCDERKLQLQTEWLENHPDYSFCVHNTKLIDQKSGDVYEYNTGEDRDIKTEEIIVKPGAQFHTSSYMYRRCFSELPKGFRIPHYGDYPMGIYLSMVGKVHYIGRVMSVYRRYTEGSWTDRTLNDKDSRKVMLDLMNNRIRMLNYANEFSNKKYDDIITDTINRNMFTVLLLQGDLERIKREYSEKYRSLSKKDKLSLFIRSKIPNAYSLYERTRGMYNERKKRKRQ